MITQVKRKRISKNKAIPPHKEVREEIPAAGPMLFINYRRQDSSHAAAYLRALLSKRFGADNIFQDINSIELGNNFPAVIDNAISSASVFISIPGRRWLSLKDENGRPRIEDPKDYVRIEIESAIRFGKRIIPIFLDGAEMPDKKNLPKSLAELTVHHGVKLSWFEGITELNKKINRANRFSWMKGISLHLYVR